MHHLDHMHHALTLAAKARGATRPNPLVGCVIVQGDERVGEGWHHQAGTPHAEVHALREAGERARGADLYVTLEPCCHDTPSKRTPPCVPQIIQAGIKRVCIAMLDPNPLVAGKGVKQLEAAGIKVWHGVLEERARELNRGYISLHERKRPWVLAKWAMTLDGKIATRSGQSKWISNELARQRVHLERAYADCVLSGIGTVLADDPMLTARPAIGAQPLRAIIDPRLETPLDSQLAQSAREIPTILFCDQSAESAKRADLEALGCEVIPIARGESAYLSWPAMLAALASRSIGSVLLEAGGRVLAGAFAAQVVDEAMVFVAPKIFGGRDALTPVEGEGIAQVIDAPKLITSQSENIGGDTLIRGYLNTP